jgi:hypothetical protein
MKATWVLAAIAFATLSSAADCTQGLLYCGATLNNIGVWFSSHNILFVCSCYLSITGDYQNRIFQAITQAGRPIINQGNSTLFVCLDGGSIIFEDQCSVGLCIDGGAGNDDYCV